MQSDRQLGLRGSWSWRVFLADPYSSSGARKQRCSSPDFNTSEAFELAKAEAEAGADASMCRFNTPADVMFADCKSVILVAPGGICGGAFLAESAQLPAFARATEALCQAPAPSLLEVKAYIGPAHSADYEVSFRCSHKSLVLRCRPCIWRGTRSWICRQSCTGRCWCTRVRYRHIDHRLYN